MEGEGILVPFLEWGTNDTDHHKKVRKLKVAVSINHTNKCISGQCGFLCLAGEENFRFFLCVKQITCVMENGITCVVDIVGNGLIWSLHLSPFVLCFIPFSDSISEKGYQIDQLKHCDYKKKKKSLVWATIGKNIVSSKL